MIAAIILAAGKSMRMGTQKLLLPYAGRTLIGHVAAQIVSGLSAGGDAGQRVIVVVSAGEQDRIGEALRGEPVTLVGNPDTGGDMLSSVRCGLRALPPGCAGILVAPGDHPGVSPDLIVTMLSLFQRTKGIIVPVYQGKRGHPLLVPARFRPEVLQRFDHVGLRGLLSAYPDEVVEMPAGECVLHDIDLPEDYLRALERLKG